MPRPKLLHQLWTGSTLVVRASSRQSATSRTAQRRPGCGARRSGRRRSDKCPDIRQFPSELRSPFRISLSPPASRRTEVPSVVSIVIVHSSPSLRRQSRLAWSGPSASGLEKIISAAIGVCAFAGTWSSADFTNRPPGKILVAIEKALMPGSNTPKPPGSHIHCWPGCHLCTSSCQRISIDDALSGERLGSIIDGRVMLRVPGGEQCDLLAPRRGRRDRRSPPGQP